MFWLIDSLMKTIKQMIEMKWMMNIHLIVYKIAFIIEMSDKISKNEMIEMIVEALIFFLIKKIDENKDF